MSIGEKPPLYRTTEEVGEMFLDFYASKGFSHIPDAGIIPRNDPTLLFINSGMAPLKAYFLGEQEPPSGLLANIQNCVRTGDIDDIGDSYHGTSFNMMGSWMLGREFDKDRAIELAHELLTKVFGLDVSRLSASVLDDGSADRGIPTDQESITAWQRYLPEDRVLALPAEDNLWGPPGDSGPCGPCTEVFYDRGSEFAEQDDYEEKLRKGRHVEIWNAGVFMQYYMDENGNITKLPIQSVDGGAGLERFAMVLQEAPSIHQIDRWRPVYDEIRPDVGDERSARIISDHLRTSEILSRSGVFPGNKAAAYILRRLLRRTISVMAQNGTDLSRIATYQQAIQHQLPEIPGTVRTREESLDVFKGEAQAFTKILARSEKLLAPYLQRQEISGSEVHALQSTYGIPVDLIREACTKNGMDFPEADYRIAQQEHARNS